MKKALLFSFVFLTILSCSAQRNRKKSKPKISESERMELFLNKQNFDITLPDNWHAVADHHYVSYTPNTTGEDFYKNKVTVFNITPKDKSKTLKQVAMNGVKLRFKNLDIKSSKVYNEDSMYGITYYHYFTALWKSKEYEGIARYFIIDGNYYSFTYSSEAQYFMEYLNDANSIFKSIELRSTSQNK